MGRKAIITQAQVNAIADKLVSTGNTPTVRSVRAQLGAGSMDTVGKYVHVWRSLQPPTDTQESVLPSILQKSLLDFVANEVARAQATVNEALLLTQEENADLMAEAAQQGWVMTELSEELGRLREQLTESQMSFSRSTASLVSAQETNDVLQHDLKNAHLEIARQQVRLERIPQLESQIAQLGETLVAERQSKVAIDTALAVLTAQLQNQDTKKRQPPRKSRVAEVLQK